METTHTEGKTNMKSTIPECGLFLKLRKTEDQNLFAVASLLLSEEIGGRENLTATKFLVELMKNYVSQRNPPGGLGDILPRSSRPRL